MHDELQTIRCRPAGSSASAPKAALILVPGQVMARDAWSRSRTTSSAGWCAKTAACACRRRRSTRSRSCSCRARLTSSTSARASSPSARPHAPHQQACGLSDRAARMQQSSTRMAGLEVQWPFRMGCRHICYKRQMHAHAMRLSTVADAGGQLSMMHAQDRGGAGAQRAGLAAGAHAERRPGGTRPRRRSPSSSSASCPGAATP